MISLSLTKQIALFVESCNQNNELFSTLGAVFFNIAAYILLSP